jgi:hypothetical protein
MADSEYEDDLDELLALAKLVKRHVGDAEYESDEELDVFGTDRNSIEPMLTVVPHSNRSSPGDWVSEDMDLVAPKYREAHEMRMGAEMEVTAEGEAKAKTGLLGEQVPWRVVPAQTPSTATPAALRPPPRRGQLVDINDVQHGAAPAPVLPQATEIAPEILGQQFTSGTYRQLEPTPSPLHPCPPPASTLYSQQQFALSSLRENIARFCLRHYLHPHLQCPITKNSLGISSCLEHCPSFYLN